MDEQKELNYKDAYYYLFNRVTDLIVEIQSLQREAEEICINGVVSEEDDTDL